RSQQAEADRAIRPHAGAVRAADRDADDQVAHQIHHVVRAVLARIAEEARRVAEVDLAADHACAHAAGVDAEVGPAVPRVVVEVHPNEGADVPVGASLRRSADERHRRREHYHFDRSSHLHLLLVKRYRTLLTLLTLSSTS